MKKQLLFSVALSLLTGCASSNLYWGPALLTYGSGDAETFASGGSRSGAEYDTARKKLKRSHPETTRGQTTGGEGRASDRRGHGWRILEDRNPLM